MPWLGIISMMGSLVLFAIETAAYVAFVKSYYRLGPAMRKSCWQLRGDVASVRDAIDRALPLPKLKSKRRGDWLLVRFRWWDASIWSRVSLHIEPTSHGAAITYGVRPFISPAVLALSLLLFFDIGAFRPLAVGYLLIVIAMYTAGLWWDLRKINSLEPLRKQLAVLGLAICPSCGYDRFALAPDVACPECGHADRSSTVSSQH